jgi:hypothetical protein
MRKFYLLLPLLALAGCEQLGIDSPATTKAKIEADGKAVGGACRHAGRAIEDCYTLNKKSDRAAIYAGWREMNEYMAENKLEPVAPVIPPEPPKPAKVAKAAASKPAEGEGDGEPDAETSASAKH